MNKNYTMGLIQYLQYFISQNNDNETHIGDILVNNEEYVKVHFRIHKRKLAQTDSDIITPSFKVIFKHEVPLANQFKLKGYHKEKNSLVKQILMSKLNEEIAYLKSQGLEINDNFPLIMAHKI